MLAELQRQIWIPNRFKFITRSDESIICAVHNQSSNWKNKNRAIKKKRIIDNNNDLYTGGLLFSLY